MRELYVGMKFLSSTDGGLSVLTDHEVSKSDYHLALADRIGAGEVNKDVSVEDTNPILTGGHKMKIVINGVEHHIKFSLEASSKIDTGDDPTIVMLGKTVVVKSGSVLQPYAVEKIDELVSSKISDCLKSLNDE
jgi:hypothetical protein